MVGLLGYAAVGALGGLGDGLTEQANQKREDKLRQIELDLRKSERVEDRAWQVEDRNFNAAQARARSASSRSAAKDKPRGLSSTALVRLEKQVAGAGGDVDSDIYWAIASEAERRMNEDKDLTEAQALSETFAAAEREMEGGGGGFFGFGATDPTPTGDYTGTFKSNAPPPADTGNIPPAPRAESERVVGKKYKTSDGRNVVWNGSKWELVD